MAKIGEGCMAEKCVDEIKSDDADDENVWEEQSSYMCEEPLPDLSVFEDLTFFLVRLMIMTSVALCFVRQSPESTRLDSCRVMLEGNGDHTAGHLFRSLPGVPTVDSTSFF